MKKSILFLSALCSLNLVAQQHLCGFDHIEASFPNIQGQNNSLQNQNISHQNQMRTNTFTPYSGPIYEIPVVVHLIESNYIGNITDNRTLKLTDAEVIKWIDNANKMYATTYGNGFFPEGAGVNGGTVIPFKLVLAKRDENLQPTTGIIRYNGDHITGYGAYGVRNGISDTNYGPSAGEMRSAFPHWNVNLYYNIYVVVGIDGNKSDTGIAGFATPPNYPDSVYDTFITVARVRKPHDTFLAHEFGHALGLYHPSKDGGSSNCPPNSNPNTDNDGVADTEAIKAFPCFMPDGARLCTRGYTNDDINPCTNEKFQGTQYNIMEYGWEPRKFTIGQRDKILRDFLSQGRSKNLIKSRGGEEVNSANEITLKNITCSNNIDRWFPTEKTRKITFGSIESEVKNKILYTDYTSNSSFYKGSYTDLIENKAETLTIESESENNFHAWIDYNNNGTFEANERITPNNGLIIPASKKVTLSVTPPNNAVKDTYVRLRILTDDMASQPCPTEMMDGNINDFAVRIVEEKQPDPEPSVEEETNPYAGRVGINTDKPRATLEIKALPADQLPAEQAQGVVFPSFTTEERSKFQNVTEGTMIFNTDLKCLEIYKGNTEGWKCSYVQ